MNEGATIAIWIFMGGALLTFLGWIAISINKGTDQLSSLRTALSYLKTSVDRILEDLEKISKHESSIVKLETQFTGLQEDFDNFKAETSLDIEKLKEFYHEKYPLHRGQRG